MKTIPIQFKHEGKTYTGTFNTISEAGSSGSWELVIDNCYCGLLRVTPAGFVFDHTPKAKIFKELTNFFEGYIASWYVLNNCEESQKNQLFSISR